MKYRVHDIRNYPAYSLLTIEPVEGNGLWFEPGQYVTISADGILAAPVRCFSVVSSPDERMLQIAFRPSGVVTTALIRLRISDGISVQGPFGDFVLDETDRPLVLLASGIGITPYMSMLKHVAAQQPDRTVILLTTNRVAAHIPFREDLAALASRMPALQTAFFTGDGGGGTTKGQITAEVLQKAQAIVGPDAMYYICGPEKFSEIMDSLLLSNGVEASRIMTEAFSQSSKSPGARQMIRRVVVGSLVGFASLAALVTGADMLRTHNKAEAAYAASHTAVQSAGSTTSAASVSSDGSSGTTATTPAYSKPTQTYSAPTTTYYSAPASRAS